VSFDDQIRAALDGTTASLREHLEAQLRAFAEQAARVATGERERAADERQQALKEASERAAEDRQQALKEASERAAEDKQQALKEASERAANEKEQALKEASDRAAEDKQQAVKAASEAVAAEVRAQAEALVADVRSQAETQVGQIRAAAQKHAEELKRAAETQIAELRKALEELRAQAQQQLDAARRIAQAEIEKAHAEVDRTRTDAERAQTEAGKVRADVETAHADLEKARADAETAHADLEKARAEAETARAQVDASRAETEAVRAQSKQEIERIQAEIETTRKTATVEAEEVLVARLTAAHGASERKTAEAVGRAYTDSHQTELSRAARLVDAIRNLDDARGLSEVLERLVQCSGHEVDRAAVLLVKGKRLSGWRLAGFTPGGPPAKSIDLGMEEAGLAGAVVKSGLPASRPSDAATGPGLPPFAAGSGERHAMALPVCVGGEVVAVLYADAPRVDQPSSDARWPAILEVLVRHASRALEAMTVEQAAGLSLPRPMARGSHTAVPGPVEQAASGDEDAARRYARLLLSEIRMYHEPIVNEGRRSGDLMSRLRGEIERARRLYEARVPESLQARAEYFDQELVRTLAGGDRTLLGSAP
jgi:rhodanese-related sulfurtransferase